MTTPPKTPLYVGLGGLSKSGKTTIARELQRQLFRELGQPGPTVMSFAAPMKAMLRELLEYQGASPLRVNRMLTDAKERPVPELGGRTPRRALQTLGTEWARDTLGPNFWVDVAARRVKTWDATCYIFDDVRFNNEADFILSKGGVVVKLVRHGVQRELAHRSEALDFLCDAVIHNDATPAAAAAKVLDLLRARPNFR